MKKKLLFFLIVFLFIGFLNITYAGRKNCRLVQIKIKNSTGWSIKVIKLEYKEVASTKWRKELTWKSLYIRPGEIRIIQRNFEHVRNKRIRARIHYGPVYFKLDRKNIAVKTSPVFKCIDFRSRTVFFDVTVLYRD